MFVKKILGALRARAPVPPPGSAPGLGPDNDHVYDELAAADIKMLRMHLGRVSDVRRIRFSQIRRR